MIDLQKFVDGSKVRLYVTLGLICFFLQAFVTSGHLLSPDGELMFRTTESLATRGSFTVDPLEYDPVSKQLLVPPTATFLTVQGRGGAYFAQYLPLQSVLAVPLVWLAQITEPVFAEAVTRNLPNTISHPRMSPSESWRRFVVVLFFNSIVQTLTVLLLVRLLGFLLYGMRRPMFIGGLLYLTTTMVWPHSRTFFTEPLATLCFVVALDQIVRWFRSSHLETAARLKFVTIMGAAFVASIFTRADSPFLVLGFGLSFVALGEWKRLRCSAYGEPVPPFPWKEYLIPGVMAIVGFALMVGFNQWRFAENATLLGGGYGDNPEGIKFSTPLLVGLQGYIMSPGKSILLFSPGIILGLWGWVYAPPQARWLRGFFIGAYFPFALAMVLWQNWDGGWCWGPRHILQLHAPIMIGAAFLFIQPRTKLLAYTTRSLLIAAGVLAQLIGSLQSPMDFYRELYLSLKDGVYFSTAMRPMELQTIAQDYQVMKLHPSNPRLNRPVSPAVLPAPLTDSLYVPQHTQWVGAPLLWTLGYCDVFVLRLIGFGAEEVPVLPEGTFNQTAAPNEFLQ
ncbi:MAG: hypothetical protein ACFCU1_12485 [Sumerlaeia bacterium]